MAGTTVESQVGPPQVEGVIGLDGLTVGIMRETPRPAELFAGYADLAVVSDSVAAPAFAKMFNSASLGASGFLAQRQLDDIHDCFAHRAKNPLRLFHLPRTDRVCARGITQCCSLLSLGAIDRRYARKFVLFVPSLATAEARLAESNSGDYVEAAMYVAAFTKSQSVYFAGFVGGDGSFSDDAIVKLSARIYVARYALRLAPLRVYFKYARSASTVRLEHLASQLASLEEGAGRAKNAGHRRVRAA
jgi:hypothetical protein